MLLGFWGRFSGGVRKLTAPYDTLSVVVSERVKFEIDGCRVVVVCHEHTDTQ